MDILYGFMLMFAGDGPTKVPYEVLQWLIPALLIIMTILSIMMIVIVLLQDGNSSGLGAISGAAETFFGKNKAKTMEGKFKRWTIIVATSLMVTSIFFFVFWTFV